MKNRVEFKTDLFPPYDEEEHEVNPGVWGKRLAEFIHAGLKRRGIPVEDTWIFRPRGIDPGRRYTVALDSAEGTFADEGSPLMRDGIRVRLEQPLTSELLILRAD